jgi:hypothetical protein
MIIQFGGLLKSPPDPKTEAFISFNLIVLFAAR